MGLPLSEGRLYSMADDDDEAFIQPVEVSGLHFSQVLSCRRNQDLRRALHAVRRGQRPGGSLCRMPSSFWTAVVHALGFLHTATVYHFHHLPTFLHLYIPASPVSLHLCILASLPPSHPLHPWTPTSLHLHTSVCLHPLIPASLHPTPLHFLHLRIPSILFMELDKGTQEEEMGCTHGCSSCLRRQSPVFCSFSEQILSCKRH